MQYQYGFSASPCVTGWLLLITSSREVRRRSSFRERVPSLPIKVPLVSRDGSRGRRVPHVSDLKSVLFPDWVPEGLLSVCLVPPECRPPSFFPFWTWRSLVPAPRWHPNTSLAAFFAARCSDLLQFSRENILLQHPRLRRGHLTPEQEPCWRRMETQLLSP